jgi:hypothetical protein
LDWSFRALLALLGGAAHHPRQGGDVSDRINLLEVHAREALGRGPEWKLFLYEMLPKDSPGPGTHFQLTGAVPSKVLFKSGRRKGQPNHKFRTDVATVIFSHREHSDWETAFSSQDRGVTPDKEET